MTGRAAWACLFLPLLALASCGPRQAAPSPVTIHSGPEGGPPPGRAAQALPPAHASSETERPSQAKPAPNPRMIPGGWVKVAPGETVYDVSRRTGSPVRDIIEANHLKPPYKLAAGTGLEIPQKRHYVVRRGETLDSIAAAEGVEVYSLARMNELTPPFVVKPGQVLTLPPGAEGFVAEAPVERAPREAVPPPPGAKPPRGEASAPPPGKPETQAPQQQAGPPILPMPPSRGGGFIWPVKGKIVGRYGTAADGAHNDGINIAAPQGTPVRAAASGVVAYAGNELRGYGNLILIKHAGGWMTAYAHNEVLLVKRGETVKRGQEIAKVGSTGIASQPQLHFELRKGTTALDPSEYLPAS
jgi:murein DD-endopeptidase MepM/ murein hydrolase activator NlpD